MCDLLVQNAHCVYVEANALPHKERLVAGELFRRQPSKTVTGDNSHITTGYPGDEDGTLDGLILSKHGFVAASRVGGGANAQTNSAFNLRVCDLCSKALDEDLVPVGALARGFWAGGDV